MGGLTREPEEIKGGLKYLSARTVKKKLEAAKGGLPYRSTEEIAADALAYVQQLVEHIRDLTKMMPEWISVKERLPERGYKVLTINGHGYIRIFALWKRTEREWCWINDAGHFNHINDITHWMPLPEPPDEVLHGAE